MYTDKPKDRILVNAAAKMLSSHEWNAFCTFTTYYPLSSNKARRLMDSLQTNLTIKQFGHVPRLFWIAELGSNKSDFHIHSLIKADGLSCSEIKKGWNEVCRPRGFGKHNLSQVDPYVKEKHGHRYVTKDFTSPKIDWDFL